MRILLTGGSGMVGRNFLEHPQIRNFEVFAPNRQEVDLFNYDRVENYLRGLQPDLIIHAAGKVGGIEANIRHPVSFLTENLDMGRNLVMAAKKVGITKLLNLGSSCMYPREGFDILSEENILSGKLEPTNEGYALANITITRLCSYISQEDSCYQYKTLVPCNLYGRWDKFNLNYGHLIAATICKLHQAKKDGRQKVAIWGDGTARREFMNAADLADALVYAINHFDTLPSIMNVGLGYDYTVDQYYQFIADTVGYQGRFTHDLSKPAGMQKKLLNISKQKAWGWQARRDIHQGIAETYAFYLERFE